MKLLKLVLLIALTVSFTNCEQQKNKKQTEEAVVPTGDNSKNALDWDGFYQGVLPCADCEGIDTRITLNQDNTFTIKTEYLGEKASNKFEEKGTFIWNDLGNTITLKNDSFSKQYFVGENTLTALDQSGNKITGDLATMYILNKKTITFANTNWKLVELMGNPVSNSNAFITFNSENNTVHGNFGCNIFNGSYEETDGQRIKLSQLKSTLMACTDMTIENQFKQAIKNTDNYSLKENKMTFNKARMAPFAVFQAEFK